MVLAGGTRLIAAGIGCGFAGAFAVGYVLWRYVFDVSATDPVTFVCVPLLLAAVALAACYVPASRAARADPMTALRT